MMGRTQLLKLAGLLVFAVAIGNSTTADAQTATKIPRIGVLWQAPPPPPPNAAMAILLKGLQDFGWHDGKTVAIEYRYGGNDRARLAAFADELVRMKVDVITTAGDLSTTVAQGATKTIPVVAVVGFPVESGFAKSLSRPGGNITGVAVLSDEMSAKRLEVLKELLPRTSRVAVLWDPVTHERQPKAVQAAAAKLGLETHVVRARSGDELQAAFKAAAAARAEAILVLVSPLFHSQRGEIVRLAAQNALPAMYPSQLYTDAGGLIAYGPSVEDIYRLGAASIDKVLKGSRAPELAIQQPTKYELDLNLKTARDLGLKVPETLVLRADRVVQ